MAALVTDSGRTTPARLAGSAILGCQSDDRLVSLIRSGHERAFEVIVDRYRRPLLRFCRGILPESRAEDAVQQTFINAHASLTDSDEAVQLKPWLFRIARNASLNMLRQNGWNYEQIPLDFDGVRRPDQVVEQRTELQQTVDAMNELPERQRSAIVMREFEGRSYEEIGAILGANDGAVRQLLNRARATLRGAATALIPPPLVARILTSAPPDGRRIAEIAGGLGAAGIAKVGATALIAGSLVVGAVEAPRMTGDHGKTTRQKATLSATTGGPAKTVSASSHTAAGTGLTTAHLHYVSTRQTAGTKGTAPSAVHHNATRLHSGSGDDSAGRNGSDDRGGSGDNSGSGGDRHSGSGGDRHSGSGGSDDTSHSGRGSQGSDDSPSSGSGDTVSSGSPSGGADDPATSSSGSDDVTAPDRSGKDGSGSGTSGSPSGSGSSGPSPDSGSPDDPDPTAAPVDGH